MVKTLNISLTSMQRLSLWKESLISFPDFATNKDLSILWPRSIVKAAVKASDHQPTTLVGEDTDLFFSSPTSTKLLKCMTSIRWNKSWVVTCVPNCCLFMPNTTSCMFYVGKQHSRNMNQPSSFVRANVFLLTYGRKSTDSLASLRYNLFNKKITTGKSFFTTECLPPTESSTKYHCQRVYFQIMVGLERWQPCFD